MGDFANFGRARLPDIARLLRLTPQRINQLERAGIIRKSARGIYDVEQVVGDYADSLRREFRLAARRGAKADDIAANAQEGRP
jgi:hypothetical protein